MKSSRSENVIRIVNLGVRRDAPDDRMMRRWQRSDVEQGDVGTTMNK